MRNRRLANRNLRPRLKGNDPQGGGDLERIERAIWEEYAPTGFCEVQNCRKCLELRYHIEDLIRQARRNYQAPVAYEEPQGAYPDQEYQRGYDDAALQLAAHHDQQMAMARQSMGQAQGVAYQRGFQAGRLSAPMPPPQPNPTQLRQQLVDDMLQQCKIIAESNPNMKPGVNAVRHRIKKLKK